MENNGKNNGNVTERYEVLDAHWVMINVQIASLRHGLSTYLNYGGNGSVTVLELTGERQEIRNFIEYLNSGADGSRIESVKKYSVQVY